VTNYVGQMLHDIIYTWAISS